MEARLEVWNGKSKLKESYIKRIERRLVQLGEKIPGYCRVVKKRKVRSDKGKSKSFIYKTA